ncbi:HupE/UreJ family protein [Steroidobacter flavus]|uniref:HupE/UreJ family protein n=1 Tax=Steroidobacter flavus TaxID=1842136 RepID=A0ABV8SNA0_9GAMM
MILLLLQATAALAHLSGFTDTSIQIAQPGVKIIYTLPADNLLELESQPRVEGAPPRAPDEYLDAVIQGWSISAKRRPCFLREREASALRTIESYQFTLRFECPQGFDELLIRYSLFGEQWRGEQNFTRVFMAGEQLRMRFTFDKKELSLQVPQLLKDWNKPLQAAFFEVDPNNKLRKDSWTGFANTTESNDTSWWQDLWRTDPGFITLGLKHILEGADHLLFVIGLLLVPASWARLAGLVTAFTVAHSITLALSSFHAIVLPPSLTEPLIALTVAAIGVENVLRTRWFAAGTDQVATIRSQPSRRWMTTFAFGLIHGIGLSYILTEMGLGDDLIGTLLFFNIGVELGQLSIVAVCLPITIWLFKRSWGLSVSSALSCALVLIGLAWFVERVSSSL